MVVHSLELRISNLEMYLLALGVYTVGIYTLRRSLLFIFKLASCAPKVKAAGAKSQ